MHTPFKVNDIRTSPFIFTAQVVCIQETGFTQSASDEQLRMDFQVEGYSLSLLGRGRGKGIATYFKEGFVCSAQYETDNWFILKVTSSDTDVINVYRQSTDSLRSNFLSTLMSLINATKKTFIVGDFNLDYNTKPEPPISSVLRSLGFDQLVLAPTHSEGGLIDHVYCNNSGDITVVQECHYFTDHDV